MQRKIMQAGQFWCDLEYRSFHHLLIRYGHSEQATTFFENHLLAFQAAALKLHFLFRIFLTTWPLKQVIVYNPRWLKILVII